MIYVSALESKVFNRCVLPRDRVTMIKNRAITIDRIVVATVESTSLRPILPKMATSEANRADAIA